MKINLPRLVISSTKGGSGKTLLSLGLIAAFKKKGRTVIPFKKGPDYIDSGWLSRAAGNPCYNLDVFLSSRSRIIASFASHAKGADIAIIEGNRGLYDGMDEKGTYSTAELAKMLSAPVLLIVDCSKSTRTVAAVVNGIKKFDQSVQLKGVVLNNVAGHRHESIVRKTIEKYCRIPVLGAFPRLRQEHFPERHMGLLPSQEHRHVNKAISAACELAIKYLDIKKIQDIAEKAKSLKVEIQDSRYRIQDKKNHASCNMHRASSVRIGIIKDPAFQFYYPENIDELERSGAQIIEISAFKKQNIPDVDALYIGGGFPETHAITLAENKKFLRSLRTAIENYLPVYAECGGLMYLGKELLLNGEKYPMTGVFPLIFSLEEKPQAHGYSIIKVSQQNPFYQKGVILKGHEFHYSSVINPKVISEFAKRNINFSFQMKRGEGIVKKMDGICYKNVLATYTHIHALGAPEWVRGMIRKAKEHKQTRGD